MNLSAVSKLTEEEARATFERIRWPNGPVCAHCGSQKAIKLQWSKAKTARSHREALYRCQDCDGQFTATMGTVLEQTHLPIRTWLMAFAIMCSSKKGVSALQLQRQLGLGSYRSAWHLAHRIRHAMGKEPMASMLTGTVEVDETYIGGKPRKYTGKHKLGRGTKKVPVLALVERGGSARARPVGRVNEGALQSVIRQTVYPSAVIMTDEWAAYRGVDRHFAGHQVVNHSKGEYVREGASTNEVEAFFALLKRGIVGSFHHVSKQHLGRYCDEFSFRWSNRKITDGERTIKAIQSAEGRRLVYCDQIKRG